MLKVLAALFLIVVLPGCDKPFSYADKKDTCYIFYNFGDSGVVKIIKSEFFVNNRENSLLVFNAGREMVSEYYLSPNVGGSVISLHNDTIHIAFGYHSMNEDIIKKISPERDFTRISGRKLTFIIEFQKVYVGGSIPEIAADSGTVDKSKRQLILFNKGKALDTISTKVLIVENNELSISALQADSTTITKTFKFTHNNNKQLIRILDSL